MVELGEGWKKLKEGDPIGRPAVTANLDPWELTDTESPTREHT